MRYPHPLIGAARRVWPGRRPDGFTLLLAALGVLGAALALARAVTYGIGLHPDVVNYISVARSLLAGTGFTQFDGGIYHLWPPLYPLLLAAGSLGIFDPLAIAGPLNAGLFGLTVFVVGIYLRTRLASRLLTLWCCLALALAWPLLDIAHFVWSETSFVLFSTLALIQTERLLSRGGNAALLGAGVFTALACLTRYAGIALPAAVLVVLAFQSGVAWSEKARRIAVYGAVGLGPLALWLLRNNLLLGDAAGNRESYQNEYTIGQMLYQIPDAIAGWIVRAPPAGLLTLPPGYALALGLAVIGLLAAACVIAVRSDARSARAIPALVLFAAMQAGVTLLAVQLEYTEERGFSPRLIAVLYLPLLLAGTLALDRVLRYAAGRNWRGAGFVLAAALCLFLLYQGAVNARAIRLANAGIGLPWEYHTPAWVDSPALGYLRAELTTGTVFSNEVWAAYIYSGAAIRHAPLDCHRDSIQRRMSASSATGAVYLLWFYDAPLRCHTRADYYGGLAPLLDTLPLEPVAAFADGVLLRYRPARADDAAAAADANANTDARRDLRQRYAAIAAGTPAAVSDSGFNLYLDDATAPRWLTYINEQCAPGDTQASFYLSIVPADRLYLAEGEQQHGVSTRSFRFGRDGIRMGRQCMVSVRLPHYAIAELETGQFDPDAGTIWFENYEPNRPGRLRAELAAARQYQPPVIQADFAVYRNDGRLIYAKEPCAPADTKAPFLLHIVPTNLADLPEVSRPHGYDNRDFAFKQVGARLDGRQCIASVALPDYDIAVIRTGQYSPDADAGVKALWIVEDPDRVEQLRAELAAARQSQTPVIQSDFAVYHSGGRLIYAKTPCAPADTEAPFLLHIVPVAANDLPESGQPHGFDNRDFTFDQAGALLDEQQCIASVTLPDYDIAAIRTGQYVPDAGRLWAAEFAPAGR